jgi:NAD(P)-dependent dehydrogenase (short-subunit alcohol dehydrogenase family)
MPTINGNPSLYDTLFVSEAFQRTTEAFGTLDIVVNNAGIFDDINWEKEVDINLVGHRYLYCTSIHKWGHAVA